MDTRPAADRPGDQTQTAAGLEAEWTSNARRNGIERSYSAADLWPHVEPREAEFASEASGYPATKLQREVGTGYVDRVATALNPAAPTLALVGATESEQFL